MPPSVQILDRHEHCSNMNKGVSAAVDTVTGVFRYQSVPVAQPGASAELSVDEST